MACPRVDGRLEQEEGRMGQFTDRWTNNKCGRDRGRSERRRGRETGVRGGLGGGMAESWVREFGFRDGGA